MKEIQKQDDSLNIIKSQLENYLGSHINKPENLSGGFNNKIFRINSEDGKKYILKCYFKDDRERLKREFSSFEYLRNLGETRLPVPFIKNEEMGYALYSFEEGKVKIGNELSKEDLDNFLSFIHKIQNLKPGDVKQKFSDAILSTRSMENFSDVILEKVKKFEELVGMSNVNSELVNFSKTTNVSEQIYNQIKKIKKIVGDDFSKEIDPSLIRLSPVDFGPHNAVFKGGGEVSFLDFEYFGWDDPSKIVANFVMHEGTWGLSDEKIQYFINNYLKDSTLPKNIANRVKIFIPLEALNWISILLWSFTPQKIASRKFANPNFDKEIYIDHLTSKIKARLNQLENFTSK